MANTVFNPFEDRFSRDLRNELSTAFANAVETGGMETFESVMKKFAAMELAPHYQSYFTKRQEQYNLALGEIKIEQHPISKAAILWNHGLYFEVHEVLEHSWYNAMGNEKLTMQALIRAAGVYIKRASGYTEAAKKIAAKAWPVLQENRDLLKPYFEAQPLIEALQDEAAAPPKLTLAT